MRVWLLHPMEAQELFKAALSLQSAFNQLQIIIRSVTELNRPKSTKTTGKLKTLTRQHVIYF